MPPNRGERARLRMTTWRSKLSHPYRRAHALRACAAGTAYGSGGTYQGRALDTSRSGCALHASGTCRSLIALRADEPCYRWRCLFRSPLRCAAAKGEHRDRRDQQGAFQGHDRRLACHSEYFDSSFHSYCLHSLMLQLRRTRIRRILHWIFPPQTREQSLRE